MLGKNVAVFTSAVCLFFMAGCVKDLTDQTCEDSFDAQPSPELAQQLENWRAEYRLPALAAAILDGANGLKQYAAVGRRNALGDVCVAPDDKFHLGSCGKAMTALMIATLVEDGRLAWNTTIGDVFPELADEMHDDFEQAALLNLLTHRAGLPSDVNDSTAQDQIEAAGGTLTEKRLAMLRLRTSVAPEFTPGESFQYANAGYTIAAAMAERVTGDTYEHLMQNRVFDPLGMTSAGFGAPGTPGEYDQPCGHLEFFGAAIAVPPGPASDNPLFTAPSGAIHCNLKDWAAFIRCQLLGAQGVDGIVSAETFEILHTAPGDDYACGWITENNAVYGRMLMHDGGNTMWYAIVYVMPDRDVAVMVATNKGEKTDAVNVINVIDELALQAD